MQDITAALVVVDCSRPLIANALARAIGRRARCTAAALARAATKRFDVEVVNGHPVYTGGQRRREIKDHLDAEALFQ